MARWNLLFCPELALAPYKSQFSQHRGHQGQPQSTRGASYVSLTTAPGCSPRNERSRPRLKFVWAWIHTQAGKVTQLYLFSPPSQLVIADTHPQPSCQLHCGQGEGAASERSLCAHQHLLPEGLTLSPQHSCGLEFQFDSSWGPRAIKSADSIDLKLW